MLYDKRGNGRSSGNWQTVGFETRANDIRAMVALLAKLPVIDSERIGLLGVSQGVWVAGIAAAENPAVSFMISISGPASAPGMADAYAGWVASRRAGLTVIEADARRDLFLIYMKAARSPDSNLAWNELIDAIETSKKKPWFSVRPLNPGTRETIGSGWYPLIMDYDPLPTMDRLDIPILWLYGGNDTQLDPGASKEILEKFQKSGKKYDVHLFPNADHGVMIPMDENWVAAEFMTAAPGFFEAIDNFLNQNGFLEN